MRLGFTEEQRHKPLCFSSPRERYQCLRCGLVSAELLQSGGGTCASGRSMRRPSLDALCSAQSESIVI